jgi:protocatechuate 3,4-dioxygenase beta subunit
MAEGTTRRSFLGISAAGAGSALFARSLPALARAQVATGRLAVPPWDDVPVCQTSPADRAGQGPFFIHNDERADDVDLFREDIRGRYDPNAEPGTEMHLHLRMLDGASDACGRSPAGDIEVYVWHTDAQGYYSGFGDTGDQRPDAPYAGVPNQNDLDNPDRFCRGAALTDGNGVVSFRSIFPGWYNGRDLHIHMLAIRPGSASRGRQTYRGGEHIFTTQFYFEPSFTDRVHRASEPYRRRTTLPAYQGAIQGDEAGSSDLRAKASFDGSLVVAQMQMILEF